MGLSKFIKRLVARAQHHRRTAGNMSPRLHECDECKVTPPFRPYQEHNELQQQHIVERDMGELDPSIHEHVKQGGEENMTIPDGEEDDHYSLSNIPITPKRTPLQCIPTTPPHHTMPLPPGASRFSSTSASTASTIPTVRMSSSTTTTTTWASATAPKKTTVDALILGGVIAEKEKYDAAVKRMQAEKRRRKESAMRVPKSQKRPDLSDLKPSYTVEHVDKQQDSPLRLVTCPPTTTAITTTTTTTTSSTLIRSTTTSPTCDTTANLTTRTSSDVSILSVPSSTHSTLSLAAIAGLSTNPEHRRKRKKQLWNGVALVCVAAVLAKAGMERAVKHHQPGKRKGSSDEYRAPAPHVASLF